MSVVSGVRHECGERGASAARAATSDLGTTLAPCRLNALVRRLLTAFGTAPLRSGPQCRATCRDSVKHALDADVLIDIRPMDALAGADETKVRSLLGCGL
jgi:hypothetical protein